MCFIYEGYKIKLGFKIILTKIMYSCVSRTTIYTLFPDEKFTKIVIFLRCFYNSYPKPGTYLLIMKNVLLKYSKM